MAWRPGRRARSTRARKRTRVARPRHGGDRLPVEDICELRMPFPPVFQKSKCPLGWPEIEFAEDVILNVDLYCAAGVYPFVEGAEYIYYVGRGSRTHSESALKRARAGYLQILDLVDRRTWPEPVRDLVRRVFNEDLAAVDRAQATRECRRDVARHRSRRREGITPTSTVKLFSKIGAIPAHPRSAILMPLRSKKELVANALRSIRRRQSCKVPGSTPCTGAMVIGSVKQLPARRWGVRAGKPGRHTNERSVGKTPRSFLLLTDTCCEQVPGHWRFYEPPCVGSSRTLDPTYVLTPAPQVPGHRRWLMHLVARSA